MLRCPQWRRESKPGKHRFLTGLVGFGKRAKCSRKDDGVSKLGYNFEVIGKRPTGRQKRRWCDTFHMDLKIAGVDQLFSSGLGKMASWHQKNKPCNKAGRMLNKKLPCCHARIRTTAIYGFHVIGQKIARNKFEHFVRVQLLQSLWMDGKPLPRLFPIDSHSYSKTKRHV